MPTIRVVVRFRPINSREKMESAQKNWSGKNLCPLYVDEKHLLDFEGVEEEEKTGRLVRCAPKGIPQNNHPKFTFDEILVWVNQETAFKNIGLPVVLDSLQGVNGTIFAYGQTGSGKTFSMFGPEPLGEVRKETQHLLGVVPRCCAEIFTVLQMDPKVAQFKVDVSFYEIYIHNEIRDLLHPAKKGDPPLKVRDGPKGVFIENLKGEVAHNLQDILALIALANSHRTVSSTKMNATSSRSHSVMKVGVRIQRKDGSRCKSQINFCDLAGSEKVGKTGASGQTLREAQAINQSLTALGNCISALAKIGSGKKKGGTMVPFRDVALTHVLKDSLAGNCKTTLMAAASPHKFNIVETISTFRFASRCKLIKTKAEKNMVLSPAQMKKLIEDLKKEIKTLKMQLLSGGGASTLSSGVGVKISWPSDFNKWPEKGKAYETLKKQVHQDIRDLIMNGVAENSSDVEEMPYAVQMSEPGSSRKVVIQFAFEDDEDDSKYDRETCIGLSKKLEGELHKMKSQMKPALQNWKTCKMFSEAAPSELNAVIEQQKVTISALEEQVNTVSAELSTKNAELENLQNNMDNLDTISVREGLDHSSVGGAGGLGLGTNHVEHHAQYTALSYTGSIVKLPEILGKTSNLRSASIFNGSVPGNSLKTTDLLSQLLHSKYEVLRSKRSLQLLSVRHQLQQDQMKQLRYTISRMQSEFMDMKATALVSKAVMSNVADDITMGIPGGGGGGNRGSLVGDMIRQASLRNGLLIGTPMALRDTKSGGSEAYLTEDDMQFAQDALMDIQLNLDDEETGHSKSRRSSNMSTGSTGSRSGNIPSIIRQISSVTGTPGRHTKQISKEAQRKARRRTKSTSGTYDNHSRHRSLQNYRPKASDAYPLKRKVQVKTNKEHKQFANNAGEYLTRKSLAGKALKGKMGNGLLNDMMASMVNDIEDDDDEDEEKMNSHGGADGAPKGVNFADDERLWKEYDKEWIRRWSVKEVENWVKKIYRGRMRKYAKEFKKKNINGKMLLDLGNQELLGMGMTRNEAKDVLEYTNSICMIIDGSSDYSDFFNDLDDFDEFFDDDEDDFFEDDEDIMHSPGSMHDIMSNEWGDDGYGDGYGQSGQMGMGMGGYGRGGEKQEARFYDDPTLRLTDLMIEQLKADEIKDIHELPLFVTKSQDSPQINFTRIKEYYHGFSQVLLLTVYGLLCNKIGLLNIKEWNDLLKECKNKNITEISEMDLYQEPGDYFDDHNVIINNFADIFSIYSMHSDDETAKLTVIGAKTVVIALRQTIEDVSDLRDDEDGVQFFTGLTLPEMETFGERIPNTLWNIIMNPLEVEFVYREIAQKCNQNVTPDRLDKILVTDLCAEFVAPDMIKQSIQEMDLNPNPTINLDVWIKRLFIKNHENAGHASETVLEELMALNGNLEQEFFKRRQQMMNDNASVNSDGGYNDEHYPNSTVTSLPFANGAMDDNPSGASWREGSEEYAHEEEKEVQWVTDYANLNKLLGDVCRFGTSGKCLGFVNVPSHQFVASSVSRKGSSIDECKLNAATGWTANLTKGNDSSNDFHWIQVDLGKVTTLFAMAVQGHGRREEWVKKGELRAFLNLDSGDSGQRIPLSKSADGNRFSCSDKDTVQVYMFSRWVKARFVRLNIFAYHGAPSLRWDLLFGDVRDDLRNTFASM